MKQKRFSIPSVFAALACGVAACGGPNIDAVIATQCPPVAPLATADRLMVDGVEAKIKTASLTCFVDRAENDLLARVVVSGTVSKTGPNLPFFVAALNEQGEIISRTQFKVTPGSTAFSYPLPNLAYAKFGAENVKARFVVGFVLTPAQLAENRTLYSQQLGIVR